MLLGLYPFTRSQFFNNEGKPLSGGFIYAYGSGTDTPATLYQDGYGQNPHAWPIELDDAGSEKIYMAPIAYKIVIKDQFGVLIEERDPVYSNGFTGGASGSGSWAVVANYNALRNMTSQVDAVFVLGRETANDGGQGIFVRDPDNATIDDDGITLVRATTDRYVRQLNGYVEPAWFGALYGQAIDNGVALTKAIDAGIIFGLPTTISGSLYFNSNYAVKSGARININGAIQSSVGITFTFKNGSKLLSAYQNAFSANLKPVFEQAVTDALKVSWFSGSIYQAVTSTIYNYDLIVDKDVDINADIETPVNYNVDFSGGSKLIVKSLASIKINTLAYMGVGQIILYRDASYVFNVMVGQSYCHLEWFGGVSSTSLNTDNSIPFKAALIHGKIYLIANATKFYNVLPGTYNAPNGLVMLGNYVPNNNTVNDLVPSTIRFAGGTTLNTTKMTLNSLKIDGAGAIISTESTIKDVIISNSIAYSTGLTKINDSIQLSPNFTAVGVAGKVIRSNNADANWSSVSNLINVNLTSIAKGPSLYVMVGQNGMLQTSPDSITWTQRSAGIATNINQIKWFSNIGKFVAVGESGKLIYSTDGLSWNTVTTTLSSIRSVAYFNSKFIIVGGSGKIFTSPDLLTWTEKIVTGLSGTLYSVDASATSLTIVGYNGTIVTSTDAINFTIRNASTINSLLTVRYFLDSTTWVIGGANGAILTSTDGVTFSLINTYTALTDNVYDITKANGEYAMVCGSGYIMTSYDLTKFNLIQPINAMDLLGITNAPSKMIAIGDAGKIATSIDGISYTLDTINTEDLNRIKVIGDTYYITTNNGKYLYSIDGVTWTLKSIGSTKAILDIVANSTNTLYTVVGANGLIATCPNPKITTPLWTIETAPVATDLNDVLYNAISATRKYIVVGKNGAHYYSMDSHTWTSTGSLSTGDIRAIFDGTRYYYVNSNNLYYSDDAITLHWMDITNNTKFTRVAMVGGVITLFGYANQSTIITSSNGLTIKENKLSSIDYTITSVTRAYITGNDIFQYTTSNGYVLNGALIVSPLTATKIKLDNVICDIPIVNTSSDINDSTLVDISIATKTLNSKITKFTGDVGSSISNSTISYYDSVGILDDLHISNSIIINVNPIAIGVFNISTLAKTISIDNSTINAPKSLLTYTDDVTVKINVNGGIIFDGNTMPLSNGYAKVFINGVYDQDANLIKNVTAYSINNRVLESELVSIGTNKIITNTKTRWYGYGLPDYVVEGNTLKVVTETAIGQGGSSLRYRYGHDAVNKIKTYGGRIRTTIKYPAGCSKKYQATNKIKTTLHIPQYIISFYSTTATPYFQHEMNDAYTSGLSIPMSSSIDGAVLTTYTNVWGGRDMLAQMAPGEFAYHKDESNQNKCRDFWVDFGFYPQTFNAVNDPNRGMSDYLLGQTRTYNMDATGTYTAIGSDTQEAYIMLSADSGTILPVGTTIEVEVIPSLPKTTDTFELFFPAPVYGIDSINRREIQYVHFNGFDGITLNLIHNCDPASQTYLYANYFTTYYNGAYSSTFYNASNPGDKMYQITDLSTDIDIEGLYWVLTNPVGGTEYPILAGHHRSKGNSQYFNRYDHYTT